MRVQARVRRICIMFMRTWVGGFLVSLSDPPLLSPEPSPLLREQCYRTSIPSALALFAMPPPAGSKSLPQFYLLTSFYPVFTLPPPTAQTTPSSSPLSSSSPPLPSPVPTSTDFAPHPSTRVLCLTKGNYVVKYRLPPPPLTQTLPIPLYMPVPYKRR